MLHTLLNQAYFLNDLFAYLPVVPPVAVDACCAGIWAPYTHILLTQQVHIHRLIDISTAPLQIHFKNHLVHVVLRGRV